MECEEPTDQNDQFPVISGATWELVDDWDCAGNDIGSQSSEFWYGSKVDFQSRADCAKNVLKMQHVFLLITPILEMTNVGGRTLIKRVPN